MENLIPNECSYTNMISNKDIENIIKKYINDSNEINDLINWANINANKFQIRNIFNTKSNIEETKFEPKNNIGIEYSKDTKNKLSYRNKPLIETHTSVEYADICNMIRITNGIEKEVFRYLLYGIKCIKKGVSYNIDNLSDINNDDYFNVLDKKHNISCPTCKSKNTIPMMIQTRAADEPPLVMHTCRDCKNHFRPPKFKDLSKRDLNIKTMNIVKKEDVRDDDPSPESSETEDVNVDENGENIS
ncbi:RNA polymerase subunit RP030 [Deerpox virus W-848-83]|uniref:DNA-directed RNA polymerase 30 kDa polypeptide n=1 Tax=Deerpox virus (strain Mule deer/United States/W-848-83/1983) TaxID=305674 RepID=Q08FV8_DPV83|nr:RNA polymerase subunit RP030 [Deerpox virus W-848-83]ABI99199.1 RNA polymerase subunit RP030 [Deerpox virus W-848-83]